MNEIKFRAWHKKLKRYFEVWEIDFLYQIITLKTALKYGYNELILEQYTGLKDENGKEVYVGDIVEVVKISLDNKKYNAEIVFQTIGSNRFAYVIEYANGERLYYDLQDQTNITVIGNIHEKEIEDE